MYALFLFISFALAITQPLKKESLENKTLVIFTESRPTPGKINSF